MAGHNKWKQIKDKKAKTDAAKARVYSKYAKLISAEAQNAGNDKTAPALRAVVERARAENVPSDVIDRAIKKAEGSNLSMEHIAYETYGPGGCAIIIQVLTNNRNKTAQEIKHILSKNEFELATPGSALWAFEKTTDGLRATINAELSDEDVLLLSKLVDDLETNEDVQEVITNVE